MSGLTSLEWLWLGDNQISDISPLAGLINLYNLELYSNNINDITALSGLAHIRHFDLGRNNISNISALVDNYGLNGFNQYESVNLFCNPLSEKSLNIYIPALEERDVYVHYGCPDYITWSTDNFSISYPNLPEQWDIRWNGNWTLFSAPSQCSGKSVVVGVKATYSNSTSLQTYYTEEIKPLQEDHEGYKRLSKQNVTVDGIPAIKVIFTCVDDDGDTIKVMDCCLFKQQSVWLIRALCAKTCWNTYEDTFDTMLSSFQGFYRVSTPTPTLTSATIPTHTATPYPTVTPGWKTYTYQYDGFSISYPVDWKFIDNTSFPAAFKAPDYCSGHWVYSAVIHASSFTEEGTLEEYTWIWETLSEEDESYSLLSKKSITIGGVPGFKLIYTTTSSQGYLQKTMEIILVKDGIMGCVVAASCDANCWDEYEDIFDTIMNSFRFID